MADDAGFLGRWSRRKELAREGQALPEPPKQAEVPPKLPAKPVLEEKTPVIRAAPSFVATNSIANSDPAAQDNPANASPPPPPPLPSLADAQALTPQSDFAPFMARGVAPDVKNAAMKKLFADPHFNVMDMMDTYVDDYSKSTPIPESVLRQMVSAQFLDLFDEQKNKDAAEAAARQAQEAPATAAALPAPSDGAATGDDADKSRQQSVAQSAHDHPDLRLQPDDAAGPEGPGPGAG